MRPLQKQPLSDKEIDKYLKGLLADFPSGTARSKKIIYDTKNFSGNIIYITDAVTFGANKLKDLYKEIRGNLGKKESAQVLTPVLIEDQGKQHWILLVFTVCKDPQRPMQGVFYKNPKQTVLDAAHIENFFQELFTSSACSEICAEKINQAILAEYPKYDVNLTQQIYQDVLVKAEFDKYTPKKIIYEKIRAVLKEYQVTGLTDLCIESILEALLKGGILGAKLVVAYRKIYGVQAYPASYSPQQTTDDDWSSGYHIIRMILKDLVQEKGIAFPAEKQDKIEAIIQAGEIQGDAELRTEAIRDTIVNSEKARTSTKSSTTTAPQVKPLPNTATDQKRPSGFAAGGTEQREHLDKLFKSKAVVKRLTTKTTYVFSVGDTYNVEALHGHLNALQREGLFTEIQVISRSNKQPILTVDSDHPLAEKDVKILRAKTKEISEYKFIVRDENSLTKTITFDVDKHRYTVTDSEGDAGETLLTTFIKMALIAKAAGHTAMKLDRLSEGSTERSDAWVAIKVAGLEPQLSGVRASSPRPEDEHRFNEIYKQYIFSISPRPTKG